jgi:hypothetical protein
MKRWLITVLAFALCSAVVRADVTVVSTTTIEGGMAAMGGPAMTPKMTSRVKGMKMRMDMEMSPNSSLLSTITDLTAKQVITLHHDQKTATIVTTAAPAEKPPADSPALNATVTPTGKSQVIDGIKCDEYAFTTSMNMGDITGPQMPPEAAAMMKDLKINMVGSLWVAKEVPGAAEYIAFTRAASTSDMAAAAAGSAGLNIPGLTR